MIVTRTIQLQTDPMSDKHRVSIGDVTQQVERIVSDCKLKSGIVTVFVTGSTAGITTIEFEPGLISDFKAMWDRVAPRNIHYEHDSAWGESNGYSHVRASLLGASVVIPFSSSRMALGTWQQIVLIDFDIRPRSREVIVQVMGE